MNDRAGVALTIGAIVMAVATLVARPIQSPDAATKSAATGPKRTLVLVTKSANTKARCSNATMTKTLFTDANSVSAYYTANSYGQVSISGDVVGPFTVAVGTTCSHTDWASQADAAATAAGVNLAAYDYRYYVNPPEADSLCPVRGMSHRPTGAFWVNNDVCDSPHYIAHELGHIFGENHASTSSDAYGDASSVMGGNADFPQNFDLINTSPHFNAPGLITVGWLPANRVQVVTRSGSYKVALLATASTAFQALKITNGQGAGDYYFSYRRAVGFDSTLRKVYVDNTSVHQWSGVSSANTYLLANVGDGHTWSAASVTVTQTGHDATYAYLTVAFASERRERAVAHGLCSPFASVWLLPGCSPEKGLQIVSNRKDR